MRSSFMLGLLALACVVAACGDSEQATRDPGAVTEPVVRHAPADLHDARWMNNGALVLGTRDVDPQAMPVAPREPIYETHYRVLNRDHQEVFALPTDVQYAQGSLTDSRVVALRDDGYTVTVWDAATVEVLDEMTRLWDVQNGRYAVIDSTVDEIFGDWVATWWETLADPAIVLNGDRVEVWELLGKARSAPAPSISTDIVSERADWGGLGFKDQPLPEYVAPSPSHFDPEVGFPDLVEPVQQVGIPSSFLDGSLASSQCGGWPSPGRRFAVFRAGTCWGRCQLVDLASGQVLKEWGLDPSDPRDQGASGCDWASWTPDEREVLISP